MPKVIIAGGGVHGTFLSHALTRTGALDMDDIIVLDPHQEALAEWDRLTSATGMRYLRSPSSHNLDVDFHAQRRFAQELGYAGPAATKERTDRDASSSSLPPFIPPYARPSLELFNAHARHLIRREGLHRMRRRGRLRAVDARPERITVLTDSETLEADYLILAVGRPSPPYIPTWARGLSDRRVIHVFDPGFSRQEVSAARRPVIIGGGTTAVQLACSVARSGAPEEVILLTRNDVRVRQFDSEPCYIGPRCLSSFLASSDPAHRRRLVDHARYPGSIPPDVAEALAEQPRVQLIRDEVLRAEIDTTTDMGIRLQSAGNAGPVITDRAVLATGFGNEVPPAPLIARLARSHRLPTGPRGYPVPDAFLRWHPRIMVCGALAELELGPAAPNIIGAHLAARRLVPFFREGEAPPYPRLAWTALTHHLTPA
ncbi:MAG: FAD-dependent oxidoreductase [Spirochaetaceae bacterium]